MRVKTFLCCFRLETGGYVIGWMTLIWFLAFSLISAVCVLALSTTKCDEIKLLLGEYFNLHPDEKMFFELCQKSRGVIIFLMTLVFFFCVCFVYFGFQCVRGVTKREPAMLKCLTIYNLIAAIVCLLGSLSFSVEGIITFIVYGLTYFYFFFVLKSLMDKFKEEKKERSPDMLYQPS